MDVHPQAPAFREVTILGIPFAAVTFAQALDILESFLATDTNHLIVTPNPECVMITRRNPDFARAIAAADLRLADGTGIFFAARYKKTPLPERVRGVDITFALLERLAQNHCNGGRAFTAYFLGAAPGVAEKAKARMEKRFPGLQVIGHHHGFFTVEDEPRILAEIRRTRPDILLVCTGMPRAEIWAAKHHDLPARITLCCGGTLDIMAETVKLAPPLWRKLGAEWLYRLCKQPARFFRMLDIPRFVWAVIRSK